jgi:tetraacyldisaccharide 4'-kinase
MNPLLAPIAAGYGWGSTLRSAAYRRGWFKTRRLARPVVSVGNLTVGGTGKTPFVAFVAERLLQRGWKPGILTRGYRRGPGQALIAVEPAARRAPDPRSLGDEPAWLARRLPEVPMVVGADRYRAGRLAEERFAVNVHILDDGFQHLALARQANLLLLDVMQEFSDRALLPAGRLREPCAALARADLVVLTRSELGDPAPLAERVRRIHPGAKIFRCSTELCGLLDLRTGAPENLAAWRGKPALAFCGIGNPGAFFRDVQLWGFSTRAKQVFPDHHVYTTRDLESLSAAARRQGAEFLLTTEKDAVNLPAGRRFDLPVFACRVQPSLDDAEAFQASLFEHLPSPEVRV